MIRAIRAVIVLLLLVPTFASVALAFILAIPAFVVGWFFGLTEVK